MSTEEQRRADIQEYLSENFTRKQYQFYTPTHKFYVSRKDGKPIHELGQIKTEDLLSFCDGGYNCHFGGAVTWNPGDLSFNVHVYVD